MPNGREKSIQAATSAQMRAKLGSLGKVDPANQHQAFNQRNMTGDLPPFNDWANYVIDNENNKIYTYGGCRPGGDISPTADFYCCDMQSLQWCNHTQNLRYRAPYDPFSKEDREARIRCLPRLQSASAAFLSINGGNYIFIFGGYDPLKNQAMSNLIAIDVDNLSWWYVKVQGGPVVGRILANLVGIHNRLYVFGGKNEYGMDGQSPSFASFCIAEYSVDIGEWRWTTCDQPYPPGIPSLGAGGKAVPVYANKKILLTSGRSGDSEEVQLSDRKTVFFHVENRTFQVAAETAGNFPEKTLWYEIFSTPSPWEVASFKGAPRGHGRPRKIPLAPSSPPSVIFCAWIPRGDEFVTPELYQYLLPPEEKIICLNLEEKIWNLELDLQTFVVVADRHFLLGYEKPEGAPDTAAVYNICVEITALR